MDWPTRECQAASDRGALERLSDLSRREERRGRWRGYRPPNAGGVPFVVASSYLSALCSLLFLPFPIPRHFRLMLRRLHRTLGLRRSLNGDLDRLAQAAEGTA